MSIKLCDTAPHYLYFSDASSLFQFIFDDCLFFSHFVVRQLKHTLLYKFFGGDSVQHYKKSLICTNKFTIKLRLSRATKLHVVTLQTWLLQDSSTQTCMHCKEFIPFIIFIFTCVSAEFFSTYVLISMTMSHK